MLTRDPAVAIAIGCCINARVAREGRAMAITSHHPRPCGWCAYPIEELSKSLEDFNVWAGWNEKRRTYEQHVVRVFVDLPRVERDRLIVEAQDFEALDDPERLLR